MICRLCLDFLEVDLALSLFDNSENFGHAEIVKMIYKYFQLKLNPEDNISTFVCHVCFDHLEEFNRFCEHVEKRQESLRERHKTEFLEVKCEELSCDQGNLMTALEDNTCVGISMPIKFAVVENKLVSAEKFCKTGNQVKTDEEFERNIFSSDDDVPLEKLKNAVKKKVKLTKESKRKSSRQLPIKEKTSTIKIKNTNVATSANDIELNCELCKEKIGNFEELIEHFLLNHTGQEAYIKCCGKTLTKKEKFARHLNWHRNPQKYKCSVCGSIMCSGNSLKLHMEAKHDNEIDTASFNCDKCERVFSTKRWLENHLKWHEKNGKIQLNCHICGKLYTNETRLKRHIQGLHEYVYPYKCSACHEPFNFKEHLDNHFDKCKNKTLLERISVGEEQQLAKSFCKICHKIFLTPQQLQRHIENVHKNITPFVCDQCGKNFKFKPAFQKHLLEHSGVVDPPVQCKICGKWLKNKNSHRLHQYRHCDTSTKCHLCGRECPSRRALKGHIENVHRLEKDYKCNYCEKSFKSSHNLEEHIATHTGAQLYTCPHCPKETRSRSNMYVHIKTNHVEEWIKSKLARSYDPNLNAENK